MGGNAADAGNSIAIDTGGRSYVAGETRSTNFPLKDPVQSTLGGTSDSFAAVISPSGTPDFSTVSGDPVLDFGNVMALLREKASSQAGLRGSFYMLTGREITGVGTQGQIEQFDDGPDPTEPFRLATVSRSSIRQPG